MIIHEYFMTRKDGTRLIKTYSDLNVYIERDSVLYASAVDPENILGRIYTETDIPIEEPENITD